MLQRLERKTLVEACPLIPTIRESSVTLPELQVTEPSDGYLGPGDYFYVPPKSSESDDDLDDKDHETIDGQEEAEVEGEVDDEAGYIILDDD